MTERIISFETRIKAKQKGFQIEDIFNEYHALTQSLLQKWIREEHGIHVNPCPYKEFIDGHITGYYVGEIYDEFGKELYEGTDNYSNYEDALEKGLFEALNLKK